MIITLYNDSYDPVVQALQKRQDRRHCSIEFISVQELLNDIEIDDEIIEGEAFIQWTLPNQKKITNTKENFVVNRIVGLDDALFDEFHPDDREYALSEFSAYLQFALEAFPRISARPGPYGLSGNVFPLPYQWKRVQESKKVQKIEAIKVPSYFLGELTQLPEEFRNTELVCSEIFNLYNWTASSRKKKDGYGFVFERPKGCPISVFSSPVSQLALDLQQNVELRGPLSEKLNRIAETLREEIWSVEMMEFLFFVSDNQISFGMGSPLLSQAQHFSDQINKFVESREDIA